MKEERRSKGKIQRQRKIKEKERKIKMPIVATTNADLTMAE